MARKSGGWQRGGMLFLPADEGENHTGTAGEHKGKHAKHRENGKSLGLTDDATLVRETSGACDRKVD
jgi:hypothetical protein